MRMPFGNLLAVLRVLKGWSRAELARRSALTKQTIGRIETVERPEQMQPTTLMMLANNAYQRKPAELVRMWRSLNGTEVAN